ncbi:MAG: hypothetical protein PHI31_10660 [Desulfuromonadaceae bacterium]|nr:hypothetical protein [Desulfuromonadaceae bacterium]
MQQVERVNITPFGELVVSVDRVSLLGNRGILHDAQGNLSKSKYGGITIMLSPPFNQSVDLQKSLSRVVVKEFVTHNHPK